MDLRQLRYFVTMVESGTLTEASRRLHIVQPALSQRLAALEADLGVQLLVRGRSGLAATEAGAELYTHARLILKQASAAREAIKEKAESAGGRISIGLLRSLAPVLGSALFDAIREELPLVRPDIVVGYSDELLKKLRATQLDLSVGVKQSEPGGLTGIYLFSESVYLLGSPKMLTGSRRGAEVSDLRDLPLLVRSAHSDIHKVLEASANVQGFSLNIVGSIEDQSSVFAQCAAGKAVTYVPETTARHLGKRSGLVARKILEDKLTREVYIYCHASIPRTGTSLAIEDVISRVVGAHIGRAFTQSADHQTPM